MNKTFTVVQTGLIILAFIALAQLAGLIGSIGTISSVSTWYAFLAKPMFTPPSWVFGPAWTILYTLMGIASYLVWRRGAKGKWIALAVYFVHLVVNTSWSLVFFGLQESAIALGIILFLDVLVIGMLVLFWKQVRIAGVLLLPYLAWLLFATYLNAGIVFLN